MAADSGKLDALKQEALWAAALRMYGVRIRDDGRYKRDLSKSSGQRVSAQMSGSERGH